MGHVKCQMQYLHQWQHWGVQQQCGYSDLSPLHVCAALCSDCLVRWQ